MRQFGGVYPAIVIDNVDPDNSGRVRVRLPQASAPGEKGFETWARIATLMAGNNRGTWFVPDVGDEVLVAFEGGDARRSYVIGGLWSRTNPPPETMDTSNNRKLLRSRNGVKVTLDDQNGQESFIVETPGGQRLALKDGPGSVEITDSNGNSVKLETSGITVNASAQVTIQATQVKVVSGMVSVDAGMSKFSGVVQCDTLVSNTVIGASYTPGAGNIW
jgi:phage baseplate assembly protein V